MTVFPSSFLVVLLLYLAAVSALVFVQFRVEKAIEKNEALPSKNWQRAFLICAAILLVGGAFLAWWTAVKPTDLSISGNVASVTTAYFNCVLYGFHDGGVFVESRDAKDGKIVAPLEQDPAGCMEELHRFKESELVALTLQGRADARELTPKLAEEYSSNKALAYRRAESVLNWLESSADKTKKEQLGNNTTLLAAGPEYVSAPLDKRLLAKDRSVFIRATWNAPAKEPKAPASGEEGTLSRSDTLALVAAIVALSAYLAAVGLFLRERMVERAQALADGYARKQEDKDKEDKTKRKAPSSLYPRPDKHLDPAHRGYERQLRLLILADVPAIFSAVVLLAFFVWKDHLGLLRAGSLWLSMALAAVIVFHVAQWIKSEESWRKRV